METERAKRLAEFVSWVGANIRGDEKGQAQVFLDNWLMLRLSIAFDLSHHKTGKPATPCVVH
jgi:hypothetical protein